MKKQLEFSVKLDTNEFNRSVEEIQRKINKISAPLAVDRGRAETAARLEGAGIAGGAGAAAIPNKQALEGFKKASQEARRDFDKMIGDESRNNEKLFKNITDRQTNLKNLKTQQDGMVKGSEEELKVREKIVRVEENLDKQRKSYIKNDEVINDLLRERERLQTGGGVKGLTETYKTKGFAGVKEAWGGMSGAGKAGAIGGAIEGVGGIVAAVLGAVGTIKGVIAEMPQRLESYKAASIQAAVGPDLQKVFARQSFTEMPWMVERQQAAVQSAQKISELRETNAWKLAAASAAVGVGLAGMATGVGAIPGAMAAGAGGLAIATNPQLQDLAMSTLPGETGRTAGKTYEAAMAKAQGESFRQFLENAKDQDPLKKMALQEYSQNIHRDLGMQRMLGLKDREYQDFTPANAEDWESKFKRGEGLTAPGAEEPGKKAKSWTQRIVDAGFMETQGIEAAQGILGAGGSTRMAQEAGISLKFQRQFDLTNANQVLGKLSGTEGGAQASQQSLLRILAEGTRLGLDGSEFREENRQFTQTAADIIYRTGGKTEGDAAVIAGMLGQFVGDKSKQGMESARTAFEEYQEKGSQTTGPGAVMRLMAIKRDKRFANLDTMDMQALLQLKPEQMTENNPVFREVVLKTKGTEEDLPTAMKKTRESLEEGTKETYDRFGTARSKLAEVQKALDLSSIKDKTFTPETISKLSPEMQIKFGEAVGAVNIQQGNLGTQVGYARANLLSGRGTEADVKAAEDAFKTEQAQLKDPTGRQRDLVVGNMAKDSRLVLETFAGMSDGLAALATSVSNFTDGVRRKALELTNDAKGGNQKTEAAPDFMSEKWKDMMFGRTSLSSQEQQTGANPGTGGTNK